MIKNFFATIGFFSSLVFAAIVGAIVYVWMQIPTESQIRGCLTTKMYHVNLCPGSKEYVPLSQISPILQKTVVLTEDSLFFEHQGFDFDEIEKSITRNLQTKKYARGASTITQQLARNMFLTKDKTLLRKFLEALVTIKIEKSLNKREILERYFNVVQFGKNIFGIKAASQFYFHKSPANLNALESAFIAMILPSPEKYSSSFFKKSLTKFARSRISKIVNDLFHYGRISEAEYAYATANLDSFISGETSMVNAEEVKRLGDGHSVDSEDGDEAENESDEASVDGAK